MNDKLPPLKDKVALITGAAGAIGYAVAQVLLENGCRVAVSDLPGQWLDDFTTDLKKQWFDFAHHPERSRGNGLPLRGSDSMFAPLFIQTSIGEQK